MEIYASPLQKISLPRSGRSIYIKRDDLIHPIVSGNKWRKLKYAIQNMQSRGLNELATFGGAYSNHMVATACAGASLGIKTHCFIRGHEPMDSHYLALARMYGMNLIQVNREDYLNKEALFKNHFGNQVYFINEGGKSEYGAKGLEDVITEIDLDNYSLFHASAAGTTALGLAQGIDKSGKNIQLHPIAVLKNQAEQADYLKDVPHHLNMDYTQGGYAKTNSELIHYCKDFTSSTGILVDPIYTGKALLALDSMILNNQIGPNENIVFLHTGGMLGVLSPKILAQFSNITK